MSSLQDFNMPMVYLYKDLELKVPLAHKALKAQQVRKVLRVISVQMVRKAADVLAGYGEGAPGDG